MQTATLYMRVGCHWCGEAYEQLRRAGFEVDEVSVEGDPDLVSRFSDRLPVVVIDGRTISEGPAGLQALAAHLERLRRADG
jgi:glutaredoxin